MTWHDVLKPEIHGCLFGWAKRHPSFFPTGPNVEAASRGYSWCLLKQLESDCTQEISALVKSSLADESKRLPLQFIPLQLAKLSFYLWLTIFLVILAVQINTVFNKPVPDIPIIIATCVWRLRVVQKLPWGAKLSGLSGLISLRSLGLWLLMGLLCLPIFHNVPRCLRASRSKCSNPGQDVLSKEKFWRIYKNMRFQTHYWYMSWHYFGKFIQDPQSHGPWVLLKPPLMGSRPLPPICRLRASVVMRGTGASWNSNWGASPCRRPSVPMHRIDIPLRLPS